MLKDYLLSRFHELDQLVTAINAYNGELEYLMVFENDEEFFETFFQDKPMEAVRAAQYGDYNYNDEYVKFDGYENLESYSEYEYEKLLHEHIDEIINELHKIKDECNWIDPRIVDMIEKEEAF